MPYTVEFDAVGNWRKGAKLTDADLDGIDKDRLLTMGAISITDCVAIAGKIKTRPDGAEPGIQLQSEGDHPFLPPAIPSVEVMQGMSYRELQVLAKAHSIPTHGAKKDALIESLHRSFIPVVQE